MRLRSVEGNRQSLDGGAMFGNAPRVMWEKWLSPDEKGRVELACRSLVLEVDGKIFLFESGIGAHFDPKLAKRFGVLEAQQHKLLEHLHALGVTPGDVDYVVLSHLHFDHAGGVLPTYAEIEAGCQDFAFPRANFIVSKAALERCLNPHKRDRASFPKSIQDVFSRHKERVLLVEDLEKRGDPLPFSWSFSHGHTPGQMHSLISFGGEKVFFCGDLIPGRAWLNPAITMGYDRFPEQLIDEKEPILEKALAEGWWLFFTHDPDISMVKLEKTEGKIRISEQIADVDLIF